MRKRYLPDLSRARRIRSADVEIYGLRRSADVEMIRRKIVPSYATGTSSNHPVSESCKGEKCRICGQPATHKVGEEIPHDDPFPDRHNWTAYVCCEDFTVIFGAWAHGKVSKGKELKKNARWQHFRDFLRIFD